MFADEKESVFILYGRNPASEEKRLPNPLTRLSFVIIRLVDIFPHHAVQ